MRPLVLQLINSFDQGGTERQAVQLVRLLQTSGHYTVHVACLNSGGVLRNEVESLGFCDIPEFPLTSFYNRNAFAQLRRFASLLRARGIQVVHTHDFYTNIFGMAAAALARVPVRIASRRETEGLRSKTKKRLERCAYRLAHAVVTNAEAVRRHLIREGTAAEKVVTIYNGIDSERISPRPCPDQKTGKPGDQETERQRVVRAILSPCRPVSLSPCLLEGRRFVTIVANLRHAVKDHPTFLRAAQRVKSEVPEAAFILAGEGELLEPMRALAAQLGLAQDAFFIGRCGNVADLLALSEVCVLSSSAEGFSNAILEYMAAARPVVATDAGGAREAVQEGETGYIVPVGDDRAMATRISALLRAPEQARAMGHCGRRTVKQKFSCAAQLERTQDLYDSLLRRSNDRGQLAEDRKQTAEALRS
jgi:glycosyltransferase involved in cell wall biosynthesis